MHGDANEAIQSCVRRLGREFLVLFVSARAIELFPKVLRTALSTSYRFVQSHCGYPVLPGEIVGVADIA